MTAVPAVSRVGWRPWTEQPFGGGTAAHSGVEPVVKATACPGTGRPVAASVSVATGGWAHRGGESRMTAVPAVSRVGWRP